MALAARIVLPDSGTPLQNSVALVPLNPGDGCAKDIGWFVHVSCGLERLALHRSAIIVVE